MKVEFRAGFKNRLMFLDPDTDQPVMKPVEGRWGAKEVIEKQLENNGNSIKKVLARGQHRIWALGKWRNNKCAVVSRNEPTPGYPIQLVVGYEDASDHDYNDILLTLNYLYQ